MMLRLCPPVAFHFKVEVRDLPGGAGGGDARFAEVGGLAMEIQAGEVPEGGENRCVQKYPTRARHPELDVPQHSVHFTDFRGATGIGDGLQTSECRTLAGETGKDTGKSRAAALPLRRWNATVRATVAAISR
jgi:hypothetical protein